MNLKDTFDRVVVVNLPHRGERLKAFQDNIKADWPFKVPNVLRGRNGHKLPAPYNWEAGPGAYGCMQSHRRILEKCLEDEKNSVLILEDDARAYTGYVQKLEEFMAVVPNDWEVLMYGGQHHKAAKPVEGTAKVVRCTDCIRTHAYGLRGPVIRDLYRMWISSQGHCDNLMGPFLANYKTYAPVPFIFSQAEGISDITQSFHRERAWTNINPKLPIVHLIGTNKLITEMLLKEKTIWEIEPCVGKHTLNQAMEAIIQIDRLGKLMVWIENIQREANEVEGQLAVVCYPGMTKELLLSVCRYPIRTIETDDPSVAFQQFQAIKQEALAAAAFRT